MSEKYESQYQRNRCKRCDRPLSNPTDDYGWRCAQIIGIENYNSTLSNLDSDSLVLYNMYVDRYLTDESNERMIPPNISTDGITNKVAFLSPTGWKEASNIIIRNADAIKNAGKYYGVNPAIIAACIYTEQITNVNIVDSVTDVPAYLADTSIGIGQVKVSTAKMLEDSGYIQKTSFSYSYDEWHGNSSIKREVWYAPVYGYVVGSIKEKYSRHMQILNLIRLVYKQKKSINTCDSFWG